MSDKVVLQGEVTLVQSIDGDAELTIIADGDAGTFMPILPVLQDNKTATPTEQVQQITPDTQYDGLRKVTVEAIPSDYVGSDVVHDPTITVNGPTVSIPEGYYTEDNTATVQTVEQATPSMSTNGATVTATVTQGEGYVSAGTKTASATVTAGTTGTPTATKGTVSNHSVTVTPSVTNTTGYITGGTLTGTGVSVSASELVSGTQTITDNGTVDVTNLEQVVVSLTFSTVYTGSSAPSPSLGVDGDIYLQV